MKAILEFTLPEEDVEYRAAVDGMKALAALSDLRDILRNEIKYKDETERPSLVDFQKQFFTVLDDHGLEVL